MSRRIADEPGDGVLKRGIAAERLKQVAYGGMDHEECGRIALQQRSMRFKFYFIAALSGVGRIVIGMERKNA